MKNPNKQVLFFLTPPIFIDIIQSEILEQKFRILFWSKVFYHLLKLEPALDQKMSVMVKCKATYVDILNVLNMAASACGTAELTEAYDRLRWKTEFV